MATGERAQASGGRGKAKGRPGGVAPGTSSQPTSPVAAHTGDLDKSRSPPKKSYARAKSVTNARVTYNPEKTETQAPQEPFEALPITAPGPISNAERQRRYREKHAEEARAAARDRMRKKRAAARQEATRDE